MVSSFRVRVASLAVLILAAVSCSAPDPPSVPRPSSTDPCPITLTFSLEKKNSRRPILKLSGTCPLPDGVNVRIDLTRWTEVLEGGQLVAREEKAGAGYVELEGQRFTFEIVTDRPARYAATVSIPLDLQEKEMVEELKKKQVEDRRWRFAVSSEVDDPAAPEADRPK